MVRAVLLVSAKVARGYADLYGVRTRLLVTKKNAHTKVAWFCCWCKYYGTFVVGFLVVVVVVASGTDDAYANASCNKEGLY